MPFLTRIVRSLAHSYNRGSDGAWACTAIVDHGNPGAWHGTSVIAIDKTAARASDVEVLDVLRGALDSDSHGCVYLADLS